MLATRTQTATQIIRAIEAGEATCESVTRDLLDRIAAREKHVQAWTHIDPEAALAQARALDKTGPRGPLHGVPVGVKDVFLTADQPTQYGSPIYEGHFVRQDAASVALARAAGAVILGKTVTTEFATIFPGATRHPIDPERTPGGSSSGSAAAVADGMVPLAYATQTAGSTVRPASYCGIVGYKPSFGMIHRAGVVLLSESLDTVGVLAGSVEDAALFAGVAAGLDPKSFIPKPDGAPSIGLCRGHEWDKAEPAMQAAVEEAAGRLGQAGASVREVDLPAHFAQLTEAHWTVLCYETARALSHERLVHPDRISPVLTDIFARGMSTPYEEYLEARTLGEECRREMSQIFRDWDVDVAIAPAAPGEAPEGLESTGDPSLNLLWTFMHTPAVSVPVFEGPNGLPMGLQVTGPRLEDARTLAAAEWIRSRLDG